MKVRRDFVTNSSSSSYIVITKVDKCPDFFDFMRIEYGRFASKLLSENLLRGKKLKELEDLEYYDLDEIGIKDDEYYICAKHDDWFNDSDDSVEDDVTWLQDHLPSEWCKTIFTSGAN